MAEKYVPGSDAEADFVFDFPYTVDEETINFLNEHGRIMFIIRGPPGTAKDSLTRMLTERYPDSKVFSADKYFDETFSASRRDRNSLKLSHDFCHKKVKNACIKNDHPIIVKNTHMKKSELQTYLDFAATYNYTVIMAVTTIKFKATPEILARSNSKGLTVEYFRNRLKAWEEVHPSVTGWFLSPDDSSYLLNQVQVALDFLLGDGKFCRTLNIYDKEDTLRYFKAWKLLYCRAADEENNSFHEMQSYCSSIEVKDHYGQCYTIAIEGYLVTQSYVCALVYLDENMTKLFLKPKVTYVDCGNTDDEDELIMSFNSLQLGSGNDLAKYNTTIEFDDEFKNTGKTSRFEMREENECINIHDCSFIQLLCATDDDISPLRLVKLFSEKLARIADESGVIPPDAFRELEDNYKMCRISEDSWFIKPPSKLCFKTVFTGIYI